MFTERRGSSVINIYGYSAHPDVRAILSHAASATLSEEACVTCCSSVTASLTCEQTVDASDSVGSATEKLHHYLPRYVLVIVPPTRDLSCPLQSRIQRAEWQIPMTSIPTGTTRPRDHLSACVRILESSAATENSGDVY